MTTGDDKKYLERLSQWDDKTNCLAPLTEEQKASIVELSTLQNKRPIPEKVCFDFGFNFCLDVLR